LLTVAEHKGIESLSSTMISSIARRGLALNKGALGNSVQIRFMGSKKGENNKGRLDAMPTKKNQGKEEKGGKPKDGKDKKGDKEPQQGKSPKKSAKSKGKYDDDSDDER
jgi:hypothetical protein